MANAVTPGPALWCTTTGKTPTDRFRVRLSFDAGSCARSEVGAGALRSNNPSNRIVADYDTILDACRNAWDSLMGQPDRINSIAARPWAQVTR